MIIIGAGLAGLLAANMLARYQPSVIERQPALPNNHSAVLRFRTSVVGDVLNVPFRKVNMIKATLPYLNPVADALAYSYKNTFNYRSDRSVNDGFVSEERWIAPSDLIEKMSVGLRIFLGVRAQFDTDEIVVSTIPMPDLAKALGYDALPAFSGLPGTNVRATVINGDAFVSLLVPNPVYRFSRISLTGSELIIECPGLPEEDWREGIAEGLVHAAGKLMGIHEHHITDIKVVPQTYAKISPIDNNARRQFIFWATDKKNVFSLGRFATWRPGLLLDDLVQDVRMIERWINDRYDMRQHRGAAA